MEKTESLYSESKTKPKQVKLVVWDLDQTLWDGILTEDDNVAIRPEVEKIIRELDNRGILQSVSSKNDHIGAWNKIKAFGLDEFFLYPKINWSSKAINIEAIIKNINIGADTVAFIDDQPFERDEVKHSIPEIRTYDSRQLENFLHLPEMNPAFITEDSKKRRLMYQSDIRRNEVEAEYEGPKEEFLRSLNMKFGIRQATFEDLKRAEELTVRTNQLNTTGKTYSFEELDNFRTSPDHLLLVAQLEDQYGTYGKIGLALIDKSEPGIWKINLFLMSCRVMSRGVGNVFLSFIINSAQEANVRLISEFVSNDRNRIMYITYKFAGFSQIDKRGDFAILEHTYEMIPPYPDYIILESEPLIIEKTKTHV